MHKKDRPMLSVTALLYGTTSPNNQILFQNNNGNNGMNPSSVSPTELSISPVPPLSVGSASGTLSPTNGSNPTFQSQTSTSSSICDNGGARTPGTPSQQYPPNHPLSGSKHLCAICEDRASGKHYGVYSCEGCKGFFKRTVRKDLTYVCRDEKHCIVDKRQRNRCQYCRYQKCLDMGMKREAVQEERQRNKPENEVESSTNSITPTFMSSSQSILNNSSSILNQSTNNNNNNNVSSLPLLHRADSVSSMLGNSNNNGSNGNNNRNGNGNNNLGSISNDSQFLDLNIDRINEAQRAIEVRLNETIPNTKIASCEIKLLFRWIRYIPYFNQLTFEDQVTLLKTGWNELLISEFSYRSIGKTDALVLANGVVVSRANANLAGVGNIMDRVLNELVAKFRAMEMDRSELGCLRAIVLLNPVPLAIKNLNNSSMVERLRDRIYSILENHCRNRYPDQSSRFAKLLVRLPALRSIGLRCVEQLFFQNLLQETNRKESIESFISNKLNSNYD